MKRVLTMTERVLVGIGKMTVAIVPPLLLAMLGILLYGLTLRGVYGKPEISQVKDNLDQATKPFELSPERGRYAIVVALAEDGTFALRKELGEMVYPDVGYFRGRFYSYFAPGISVFALPFYRLGLAWNIPQVAAYASVALTAILNLLLLYAISRAVLRLPRWAGLAAAIIFGFGTSSWSYALTLYQHHMTTFLILSSLLATWLIRRGSRYAVLLAAWVWFAFGYGVFIDYPNVLLMAPVMIYFAGSAIERVRQAEKRLTVRVRPSVLLTSVILITWIVIHGWYNQVNFGNWKRVSGSLVGYKAILEMQREKGIIDPEEALVAVEREKGVKNPVKFFAEDRTPFGFYTLLWAPDRGLLLYAPVLVFALLGIAWSVKHRQPETVTMLASVAVIIFLYSSWGDPWGGWAFGPRYMIPAMAMLSLFAVLWLVHGKLAWLFRLITVVLFGYSSAVALLGALTTNAVPPKIEGDYLGMDSNFVHNLKFLTNGQSGSFVLNTYLSPYVTLGQLFGYIWVGLQLVMILTLLVWPTLAYIQRRRHGR